MTISNKQFKTLAREFGLDADAIREQAAEEGITSVADMRAFLQADTGDTGTGDDSAPADAPADETPAPADSAGGTSEQAVAAACKAHGIPRAGWHRFLTGNGPADLPTLLPGRAFTADQVLGVWKSGGKGMNVRKLVGRLACTA
jgi:hypothetical protein